MVITASRTLKPGNRRRREEFSGREISLPLTRVGSEERAARTTARASGRLAPCALPVGHSRPRDLRRSPAPSAFPAGERVSAAQRGGRSHGGPWGTLWLRT